MRSNQRPFARGIIAGRVYYVSLYARPTENLQNAFLNECEIVQVQRARSTQRWRLSLGNFATLAFVAVRLSRLAYKFATSATVGRNARDVARESVLLFLSTVKIIYGTSKNSKENCARVFLLAEILSGGSLCDLKRSTVQSLCPRALQSVKLK